MIDPKRLAAMIDPLADIKAQRERKLAAVDIIANSDGNLQDIRAALNAYLVFDEEAIVQIFDEAIQKAAQHS